MKNVKSAFLTKLSMSVCVATLSSFLIIQPAMAEHVSFIASMVASPESRANDLHAPLGEPMDQQPADMAAPESAEAVE